jgi:PAP2 superfamily
MRFGKQLVLGLMAIELCGASVCGHELASADDPAARGDGHAIRQWNQIATNAVVVTGANAPASSGVLLAIVQLGVYDAVVAIRGGYRPYATSIAASKHASVDAAVAQSAHDVLVALLPQQAATLDEQLAAALAQIPDGPAKTGGTRIGARAAAGILAEREGDGRFAPIVYVFPQPVPGAYQPTPPAYSLTPLVPWVAEVRPFTMTSPSQFRPPPPPPLGSLRWARGYSLTQAWGSAESAVRNAEQSEIAIFWTEHTAQHWNRNIATQAERENLGDLETARLLALTNAAMADAWIGCWDAKYHYNFWRPVTAIQQGDTDGRADTSGDPSWTPFRTTPNHPEYPGAHACVSTAASYALARYFRRDRTTFPMDAVVGGVTYVHWFSRYTDAGGEAAAARIYGGMHYFFSNDAGARLGRRVVDWMFARGFFERANPLGGGDEAP